MKILITGGAGFIGSHVADVFIAAGHQVVVVDNLSTGRRQNIPPQAKFYCLDICDPALEEVFAAELPDIVDHHAAQISVPRSIEDPAQDAGINILGLINVLQCCVKYNIRKVIYISSGGAIYGDATQYPTTEEYPPQPLSVYAVNKLAGESYLYYYNKQFGLKYTTLRYANVYGPRQNSQGEAGVVSIFIEKMLSGQPPSVYAYPEEPDGMIRDYVFVADVARANLLALEKGENNYFNIGTCQETTTMLLFNSIMWQLGMNLLPVKGGPRKGDLRRSMLDYSKAFHELGWSPLYSLEDGIKDTINYYKEIRGN